MRSSYPEIGLEIPWVKVIRHLFRVLEFERTGTTIGPTGEIHTPSESRPYGYLIVESPVVEEVVRLPIVHRDDFLLAASVFDEPRLADLVHEEELLVTYAPRKVLSRGLAGNTSHALHYVMTSYGTLEDYYKNESYKMKLGWKQRKDVATDLKTIYSAATEAEAEQRLTEFSLKWDAKFPTIAKSWRSNWARVIPSLHIRRRFGR